MTKWKLPTKNRIKTKHLIIYHLPQNRQVDQVFHVDQLPDERAIPKEDQDMKFLYDLLSKVKSYVDAQNSFFKNYSTPTFGFVGHFLGP